LAGGIATPFALFGPLLVLAPLPEHLDVAAELSSLLPTVIFSAMFAAFGFAAGIALLGGPVWSLLHALGLRAWPYAIGLGAALAGGVASLLMWSLSSDHSSLDWLGWGLALAAAGGLAGFVVWRVAYRPKPTPQTVF
jgi:hypothetical protein